MSKIKNPHLLFVLIFLSGCSPSPKVTVEEVQCQEDIVPLDSFVFRHDMENIWMKSGAKEVRVPQNEWGDLFKKIPASVKYVWVLSSTKVDHPSIDKMLALCLETNKIVFYRSPRSSISFDSGPGCIGLGFSQIGIYLKDPPHPNSFRAACPAENSLSRFYCLQDWFYFHEIYIPLEIRPQWPKYIKDMRK